MPQASSSSSSREDERSTPRAGPSGSAFAALDAGLSRGSRKKVDAFLDEQATLAREQTRLTQLQARNLAEQNAFELSHLRWRAFNEKVRGATYIALIALAVLALAFLGLAMWRASRAHGVVVERFSTPPALAAAGITGEVLADDLTNAISVIREIGEANSMTRSEAVRHERDDDIRVEIPETGVSLDQVWRFLRGWLGNERHLRGDLRTAADGTVALTVGLDGERARTFSGPLADLPRLEQQAAEYIFERVDPNNYITYSIGARGPDECMAAAKRYAERYGERSSASARDRASALSMYGGMTRSCGGDLYTSITRARAAARIDPKVAMPGFEVALSSLALSHPEDALQVARTFPRFRDRDQQPPMRGAALRYLKTNFASFQAELAGDFQSARERCGDMCVTGAFRRAELTARLHDPWVAQALLDEAEKLGPGHPDDVNRTRYFVHASIGDWAGAAGDARAFAAPLAIPRPLGPDATRLAVPLMAHALARAGNFAAAEAAVAPLPMDCYDCLRERGRIAALQGRWTEADAWFAKAIAFGPSLPFAYADRGEMLLAQGNPTAAFAPLAEALERGPRYADALELMGEALAASGQPAAAIAKYQAAGKLAPNWGRLHLKWGQSLAKAGKPDAAKARFKTAAGLYLTPEERTELGRH